MNELALFAGAGGGILGGKLLGWRTICAVEINDYCRRVLMQRQDDGILEPFPIWDDIRTFDGRPWQGVVDVVSGGFPCQDISAAGKGAGIEGERSGLWREMARVISEVRPRFVFVENSPLLVRRGLAVVLGGLAEMGFDAQWGVLGAIDAGAPHRRDRIWLLGWNSDRINEGAIRKVSSLENSKSSRNGNVSNANHDRHGESIQQVNERWCSTEANFGSDGEIQFVADSDSARLEDRPQADRGAATSKEDTKRPRLPVERLGWWSTEPDVGRVVDGLVSRVDRLRAIGNGQVPAVVRLAWQMLSAKCVEG